MYGTVVTTEQLTPDLVRVVLGGEGLADFTPSPDTDAYVNASFLPVGAPYSVPFDEQEIRHLPRELRPFPRRYTVRRWDEATRELTIDFVVHGDVGLAGRWAAHAEPGDRLQMKGPGGGYRPHDDADCYLLVGDESALPAIAASAEAVPEGRPVVVVVEIESSDSELVLHSPGELDVQWVHRRGSAGDPDTLLVEAVQALPRPGGVVSAFVHGEAVAVRAVRRHLLAGGIVDRDRLSVSPYWRRGHTDEQWRSIKADWQREVETDVPLTT
ncbi:Siderophore-interacting FAD-binding domain protein [Aeromicrobium marinum DSM 15272]|uniref:Siderophore-interacting FAD-binding domain protein n=1 Tax=Aeromicrobium marinum DSM 15272 TaxID=585531 RepID=E2SCG0_9ACTN|nr:siderophore-interacting protein [Aeromicrobium marinum]EFQ82913.1 Siderophore-interacting FAD-binding domain protein [Aeromicrobium marinum DSM 15272]